jgi:uncharacterized protein YecE (DUF72 family)
MENICTTLDASILHIQTPSWLTPKSLKREDIYDLLGSTGQLKIAWEMRSGRLDHKVTTLMRDLNIIHCTDLSLYPPAYDSDTVYARLFGVSPRGKAYRFKERELESIQQRVLESNAKQAFLTFHSLQMYEDAYVMQMFHQEGTFPSELKSELSIPVSYPLSISD